MRGTMNEIDTPFKKAVHMIIHGIINGEESYVLDRTYVRWGKVERDLWALEAIASQPANPVDGTKAPEVCPECGCIHAHYRNTLCRR